MCSKCNMTFDRSMFGDYFIGPVSSSHTFRMIRTARTGQFPTVPFPGLATSSRGSPFMLWVRNIRSCGRMSIRTQHSACHTTKQPCVIVVTPGLMYSRSKEVRRGTPEHGLEFQMDLLLWDLL
jgi:hypothetical protein